nr:hypothetical protein Iba_chr15bCG3460 [Ipomoea batatas]
MGHLESVTIAIIEVSPVIWTSPRAHEIRSRLSVRWISPPRKANCLFPNHETFQLLQCFFSIISAKTILESTSFPDWDFY